MKNTSRHSSVERSENCHFSSSKVPQMALTMRSTVSFKVASFRVLSSMTFSQSHWST